MNSVGSLETARSMTNGMISEPSCERAARSRRAAAQQCNSTGQRRRAARKPEHPRNARTTESPPSAQRTLPVPRPYSRMQWCRLHAARDRSEVNKAAHAAEVLTLLPCKPLPVMRTPPPAARRAAPAAARSAAPAAAQNAAIGTARCAAPAAAP